ncbi:ParB/RepB/Spo0J family partition protein [Roseibium sp.]|uniref:ParB/RepB/Spo0J family partition protein n=1 Tax=Roseibium sp. TaxID=1936156 RepID=UPI003A96E7B3
MQVQSIKIGDIEVPAGRLRAVDLDWAETLSCMFSETGHKTPIDVCPSGDGFQLVAGAHRLAAARLLKWKQINARVLEAHTDHPAEELRLHEVLENLARKDFNALERCEALHELKRIYEVLHPVAKHGGDRKSQAAKTKAKNQVAIFAFCSSAADTTGLSDRSVRLAVQIFEGLSPESRERLKGSFLADKQSDLKALSELTAADQAAVLDQLLATGAEATSVCEALMLADGKKPLSASDKVFRATQGGLTKLNKVHRGILFSHYKDEILALALKEGWFHA